MGVFKVGYPGCHECCARHYFVALWGVEGLWDVYIKMSLS
jgi:hypothetical protein